MSSVRNPPVSSSSSSRFLEDDRPSSSRPASSKVKKDGSEGGGGLVVERFLSSPFPRDSNFPILIGSDLSILLLRIEIGANSMFAIAACKRRIGVARGGWARVAYLMDGNGMSRGCGGVSRRTNLAAENIDNAGKPIPDIARAISQRFY